MKIEWERDTLTNTYKDKKGDYKKILVGGIKCSVKNFDIIAFIAIVKNRHEVYFGYPAGKNGYDFRFAYSTQKGLIAAKSFVSRRFRAKDFRAKALPQKD